MEQVSKLWHQVGWDVSERQGGNISQSVLCLEWLEVEHVDILQADAEAVSDGHRKEGEDLGW